MSEISTSSQPAAAAPGASRGPSTRQLIVVVAILGAGILLTALTSDVTKVSEPGIKMANGEPFLPAVAGHWTGGEQTGLSPEERQILPADTEGVRRAYTDAQGRSIYCSVVLAGRDVTSIHRPELCLKGQGWQLDAPQTMEIETAAAPGGTLRVSRMAATGSRPAGEGRSAVLHTEFVYWFVGKDRTTPYHWQRILWTTEDRVLHNRNHRWAYFLINIPVDQRLAVENPPAAREQAEQLIRQFIQDIYPSLAARPS
jgi:EpsI family protein